MVRGPGGRGGGQQESPDGGPFEPVVFLDETVVEIRTAGIEPPGQRGRCRDEKVGGDPAGGAQRDLCKEKGRALASPPPSLAQPGQTDSGRHCVAASAVIVTWSGVLSSVPSFTTSSTT